MSASSEQDTGFEFDAFASYSTDPDYRLVRQTESFLESFHKRVASASTKLKPLNICVDGSDFRVSKRGGEETPDKIDPVSNLIVDNLAKSRWLILFCSAKAACSPWVGQELQWFLDNRGPDSVLIAVTDGNNPGEQPDECFSALAITAGLHGKPWYDLRQAKPDWKDWSKVRDLADEQVRLAAHLNDQSAGELLPLWRREEHLRQRRRQWITTAVAVVLLFLSAAAVWFGINAEKQRRLAVARLLAVQSDARLDTSVEGLRQSLLMATESLSAAWTTEGYAAWTRAIRLAPRHPRPLAGGGTPVVDLDSHIAKGWLALAGNDGVVRIVEPGSDTMLRELAFLDNKIPAGAQWPGAIVRFSPDGTWLAVAAEYRLSIWDTQNWERKDFEVETEGYFDLAFDTSGERLAMCGYAQACRLIKTGTWQNLRPPNMPNHVRPTAVEFTDSHLVTAERSGEIVFWTLQGDKSPTEALRIDTRSGNLHDITFSPSSLALAVSLESGIYFWPGSALEDELRHDRAGEELSTVVNTPQIEARELNSHHGSWTTANLPAHRLVFSTDGAHLLSAASSVVNQFDTAVRLWDAGDGNELSRFHPGGTAVFLPGAEIAIGGISPAIWSLPHAGSITTLSHTSNVESVAFSPDGRWLAAGLNDHAVLIRQAGTWAEEIVIPTAGSVAAIGFTPDGQWLIVRVRKKNRSNPASLQLFETGTWKASALLEHEDDFRIAVSPDSQLLQTFTRKLVDRYAGLKRAGRSRVWELATGEEIAWRAYATKGKVSIRKGTLPLGEEGDPLLLDQAKDWPELRHNKRTGPKGLWLIDGSSRGLSLLAPDTQRRIVKLRSDDAAITDVSFSPNGRWLAAAEKTSLHIWLLGPVDALVEEACKRLAHTATDQEKALFFDGETRVKCSEKGQRL